MGAVVASQRGGVGALLREWRRRRRFSQLELGLAAGVSARHVSFLETGRARPSPEMVLQLAAELDVPLRERNRMLLAAGYAARFEQRGLDEPEMEPVRAAIEQLLAAHEPYPAAVIDGAWELLAANAAVGLLTDGVRADLLEPPLNVLRVSLHPDGMAPRIRNLDQWSAHLLARLERQIALTGDPAPAALHDEVRGYAPPRERERGARGGRGDRRSAAAGDGAWRAHPHQHGRHLRHGGGDHRERAVDRVVLPGRSPHRRGASLVRRALTREVFAAGP
jgi:transcriptional regulator with XRE-family HTH domain